MSWKNHLKEKAADAARLIADKLPTVARYAAYGLIALEPAPGGTSGGAEGLSKIASELSNNMAGLYLIGGAVGAALLGVGALIRFLPGTSADLRQTAMKMVEGGIILLAIIGTGSLILQGAFGIGKTISDAFKATPGSEPKDYFNPWSK
jgi:hypothetical protein